jgi:hypothetical protein
MSWRCFDASPYPIILQALITQCKAIPYMPNACSDDSNAAAPLCCGRVLFRLTVALALAAESERVRGLNEALSEESKRALAPFSESSCGFDNTLHACSCVWGPHLHLHLRCFHETDPSAHCSHVHRRTNCPPQRSMQKTSGAVLPARSE